MSTGAISTRNMAHSKAKRPDDSRRAFKLFLYMTESQIVRVYKVTFPIGSYTVLNKFKLPMR